MAAAATKGFVVEDEKTADRNNEESCDQAL
jgi:hypothetical protein